MLFAYTFWIPTGRWDEQAILGPFGEDSDLRRWGLKLAAVTATRSQLQSQATSSSRSFRAKQQREVEARAESFGLTKSIN
jgi:hypothetical protein